MRTVRHKADSGHVLFRYPYFDSLSDCDDRIICLSERSMAIILNAIEYSDQMRTRVYSTSVDDQYTLVSDEEWSNFQYWVSTVRSELGEYMACNELLERIAIALEAMEQRQDEQTVNLLDVFEALGIEASESEADILEALEYLINFPGLPAIPKLPLGQWITAYFESRYKSAHLQLLRDMSISQRGMAVAQGGVDFAGLYDTMGETADSLLVQAGYAGKAYWLWRWIDNDQIPGWVGWLSTISGLVLGSIRGATYSLVGAIEELAFPDIVQAIADQTDTTIVNCNNCSASELYEIVNDDINQAPYAVVEQDSGWTDFDNPPSSEDATWTEPSNPSDTKCQGAHYITGWLIGFYGSSSWNLQTTDNTLTLAEQAKNVLANLPPIGVSLNAISVIIGRTLQYLASGSTDIFVTINEVLVDLEDELVCAIYNADSPGVARNDFIEVLFDDGRLTGFEQHFLEVFLATNNVMAVAFYTNDQIGTAIDDFGTDCSSCGGGGEWQIQTGYGTGDTSVNPMVLSGQLSGGKYRLYLCRTSATESITFSAESGYSPSPSFPGANDATHVSTEICGESPSGDLYQADAFPDDNTYDTGWIGFNSNTPFTVNLLKV